MILKGVAEQTSNASADLADDEMPLLQGEGSCGVLLASDVPEMVDHVVQEVLKERRDRELGTI